MTSIVSFMSPESQGNIVLLINKLSFVSKQVMVPLEWIPEGVADDIGPPAA